MPNPSPPGALYKKEKWRIQYLRDDLAGSEPGGFVWCRGGSEEELEEVVEELIGSSSGGGDGEGGDEENNAVGGSKAPLKVEERS